MATLLVVSGHREAAVKWLAAHAVADEVGDYHWDEESGRVTDVSAYVDSLWVADVEEAA
ncbi:MAG: hypothetical protein HOY71_15665 [Nonomuraea sp.]|nr:hypothetical protein [Nonomuraea sp.]